MEYFDVYNCKREFQNKTLPRGTVLSNDEFNQGISVWIFSDNNKVLITQRCELKSHPLMWEVPGGCSLAGETSIQTVIREIYEEIGLQVEEKNLIFLSTQIYKNQFVDIYKLKFNINISNLVLQKEEISQAKLVSFDEFENMIDKNQIVNYTIEQYNIIKKLS